MTGCRLLACLLLGVAPQLLAQTGAPFGSRPLVSGFEEDYEKKPWQEIALQLPAPPRQENLLRFDVGPATRNAFFIDPDSISIGEDGVIRYTLVAKTPEGASNVSFEGIRCETRERRFYAFGRSDGTWSRSRNNQWEPVREGGVNRQHAALFQEYFCPAGVIADSVKGVQQALRQQHRPALQYSPPGR